MGEILALGESRSVRIDSRLRSNRTGIVVEAGSTYRFDASGMWKDKDTSCDPDGYPSPKWYFRLVEWRRRLPPANWFALCGQVTGKSKPFLIGKHVERTMVETGELTCFANDLRIAYANNCGSIDLTVTRLR
jgi:hypothetical protein